MSICILKSFQTMLFKSYLYFVITAAVVDGDIEVCGKCGTLQSA